MRREAFATMEKPAKPGSKASNNSGAKGDRLHIREHLANERTFLSWIRTSVGILALGFVMEKFSLFMWLSFDALPAAAPAGRPVPEARNAAAGTVAQFGIQTGEFGNGISDPKFLPAGKVVRGNCVAKRGIVSEQNTGKDRYE